MGKTLGFTSLRFRQKKIFDYIMDKGMTENSWGEKHGFFDLDLVLKKHSPLPREVHVFLNHVCNSDCTGIILNYNWRCCCFSHHQKLTVLSSFSNSDRALLTRSGCQVHMLKEVIYSYVTVSKVSLTSQNL